MAAEEPIAYAKEGTVLRHEVAPTGSGSCRVRLHNPTRQPTSLRHEGVGPVITLYVICAAGERTQGGCRALRHHMLSVASTVRVVNVLEHLPGDSATLSRLGGLLIYRLMVPDMITAGSNTPGLVHLAKRVG